MQSEDSWEIRIYKIAKKMFLSTFVVFSFLAYVVHEKFVSLTAPETTASLQPVAPIQPTVRAQAPATAAPRPTEEAPTQVPSIFQPQPTLIVPPTEVPPTDVPATQGQYKNGEYTGPQVDAFYGLVQVKAVVQNGQIASVDFLEFPQDRRTSQRINAVAVPYLKMEAVQAQSANVNIISGATLTSEAFMMSLQSALDSAKR